MIMKTKTFILLTLSVVLLASCDRDEDNLFDKDASLRLNEYLAMEDSTLVSATSGWEMLYFPNPESCGYNMLLHFENNGRVKVAAQNSLTTHAGHYAEDNASTWVVRAEYAPMLSFNTYNTVLHAWADPQDDGDGYLGDYEFMIFRPENDQIKLKGKKHSGYSLMIKLEEGQDWKQYFKDVEVLANQIFTDNNGMRMTLIDGDSVYRYEYNDGIFSDPDSLGGKIFPMIVRPNCIQLYDQGINGAIHFVLSEDKSKLICTDAGHEDARIEPALTPCEYFQYAMENKARWTYSAEGSDIQTQGAVNRIKQKASENGATIDRIAIERVATLNSKGIKSYSYALFVGYLVNGKVFEGSISLKYTNSNNQLIISDMKADKSLDGLLERIDANKDAAVQAFADIFCDTYVPTPTDGCLLNMIHTNLQSQTKKGKTIHVIANSVSL